MFSSSTIQLHIDIYVLWLDNPTFNGRKATPFIYILKNKMFKCLIKKGCKVFYLTLYLTFLKKEFMLHLYRYILVVNNPTSVTIF